MEIMIPGNKPKATLVVETDHTKWTVEFSEVRELSDLKYFDLQRVMIGGIAKVKMEKK